MSERDDMEVAQGQPAAAGKMPIPVAPRIAAAPAAAAEALARALAGRWSAMLNLPVEIHYCTAERICRRELAARAEEPTCCWSLADAAARPQGRLELSPVVALAMLERMLGGQGLAGEPRALTASDRHVLLRAVEPAATALGPLVFGGQWRPTADCSPPAGEGDVVVMSFNVCVGAVAGALRLAAWAGGQGAVATSAPLGPMELSVSLRDIDVPASDAERLCDGDIVATGLPADGEVIVRLAGIPKFLARMGQVDGRRAITILRRL